MLIDAIVAFFAALGVFFMVVASVGVLRLRDFYQRLHAPTKAATLGLFSLLVATALALRSTQVVTKAALALLFIGATAPVGAHVLSRAAYRRGVRGRTTRDEYAEAPSERGPATSPPDEPIA